MNITVTDTASPGLRAKIAALTNRSALNAEMGMGVETCVVRHMGSELVPRPNRLGAPSTGFWQKAIGSVRTVSDADAAEVSIPYRGVALQYYGGRVVATNKVAMTIPIAAAAHGHTVADFHGELFRVRDCLCRALPGGGVEALFVLRKSVMIRPHPEVIPPLEELQRAAVKAGDAYFSA